MPRAKPVDDQKLQLPSIARRKNERCMVCKESMPSVTPGHLREHGLTVARYERLYGERLAPSRAERVAIAGPSRGGAVSDPAIPGESDPPAVTVDAVAERLLDKKVWLSCLADEVQERMMTGPLKTRLNALLVTMLYQRSAIHGEALAILHPALAELQQEWRLAQGGENGAPTDTDVLLRIVDRAAKIVSDSEDAVQKTIKLALEEQKASTLFADGVGPTLYQGTGEKLDMPSGIPTSDRETIRNLLSLIGKATEEARTVDLIATRVPEGDDPQGAGNGERIVARVPEGDESSRLGQGNETPRPPTPSPSAQVPEQIPSPTPQGGAVSDPTSTRPSDPTAMPVRARRKKTTPSSSPGRPAPGSNDGEARQRPRSKRAR